MNNKNYKIKNITNLSKGSKLSAEEVELETPIQIENHSYINLLIKQPVNNVKINHDLIRIYSMLKKFNIPTTNFFFIGLLDDKEVFVTENLNLRTDNVIYVSSNYNPNAKIKFDLDNLFRSPDISIDKFKLALSNPDDNSKEYQLYTNKIELKEFDLVIKKGKELAEKCFSSNVFFPDDSLFYGVNLESSTVDNILIGDFDFISFDSSDLTLNDNYNTFKETFIEFLDHFVKEPEEYIKSLKNNNL